MKQGRAAYSQVSRVNAFLELNKFRGCYITERLLHGILDISMPTEYGVLSPVAGAFVRLLACKQAVKAWPSLAPGRFLFFPFLLVPLSQPLIYFICLYPDHRIAICHCLMQL